MQPQVGIGGRIGWCVDVDRDPDRPDGDVAQLVMPIAQAELGVEVGVGGLHRLVAELAPPEPAVPGVERRAVCGDRGEAGSPGGSGHVKTSGRSVGNRTTSRMLSTPASSIATRSMPIPRPPVGGMPYSSARR